MIERLNSNANVGVVVIELSSDNKWNNEILTIIANKYSNVYHIEVHDYNNSVDGQIHDWIQKYI